MSAVFQDISVSISRRRRACVLDPALALSSFGVTLAQRLSEVMELWVPREFWRILDNTHFYLSEPEQLPAQEHSDSASIWQKEDGIFRRLQEWERIRAHNDPLALKLFWIGDGLSESMLPPESDAFLFKRFELLGQALDKRLQSEHQMAWAFRDAVVLSVLLPAAVILCHMDEHGEGEPSICRQLHEWGVAEQCVDSGDEWLHLERSLFRQQLVAAGLAKWRWCGMRLALLQVVAPAASLTAEEEHAGGYFEDNESGAVAGDYWQGARAFWYPL